MLAVILGIFGCLGFGNGSNHADLIPEDTVILNSLDTTVNRVLEVNRIIIIGNKITKDRIISRELSLKPGDTISTRRISQVLVRDKNKVYNLRLFNTVSVRVLPMSEGIIDLLVEVTERWYLFPSPIFELADRNFNEWVQNYNHDFSRVNYGLHLYQYNFRGRNETLRMTAQFGFNRKFDLSYQIPYIDKKQKKGLIINFDYGEPRNLASYTQGHILRYIEESYALKRTFGTGLTFNYRKNFYETHSFSVGYRTGTVADTVVLANPNYYKNNATSQHFFGLTYSFNSDHRDVILYPLKGYQYNAYLSYSGFGSAGVNLYEINLSHARHWDLKHRLYLSNFTSGYLSTPTAPPYNLYSALGYRRQVVRGYEIYVIEGPKYILNKTTLKKRIFRSVWRWEDFPLEQFRHIPMAIYIKGYLDMGYVENYPYYQSFVATDPKAPNFSNRLLTNHIIGGAGGGFDIVTMYDLVFRLEYTFTREGNHGFFFNVKKEF